MSTVTIPRWNPKPPGGKYGPIGGRSGRFRVRELTVYFRYLSDEAPSQDRDFEFTLRVPLTRRNRRRSDMFWEFVASTKMEEVGIHVAARYWDEGIVGDRYVGRSNAYKPRYVCINKRTKWCMPKKGGWGTLWWRW